MTSRARSRRYTRGAALVEASAVMPVILIFYGLMVFVFREYDVKTTLMAKSRDAAFRGALHQCGAGAEVDRASADLARVPGYGSPEKAAYSRRVLDGAEMETFVTARGMKATSMSRDTVTNAPLSQLVRTRELTASSQVYCVPLEIQQVAARITGVPGASRQESLSLARALVDGVLAALISVLG
jgi:hypothetical protein